MEKRIILLNGQSIEYVLERKNIKSLYMKIEKGQLVIKAPIIMPLSFIEKNIEKYQERLLAKLALYQPYYDYKDQGFVLIFNEYYHIVLRDIGKRKCSFHDHYLYVYHHDIEKTVETFLKKILLDYIEEKVIGYLVSDFDLDMPFIEVKKYKGRWGSCFYKDNKITFNLSLVYLEKDLIDYVIVHELSHFIETNHSQRFYQEMKKRMPDYKDKQKRLKEKHI